MVNLVVPVGEKCCSSGKSTYKHPEAEMGFMGLQKCKEAGAWRRMRLGKMVETNSEKW